MAPLNRPHRPGIGTTNGVLGNRHRPAFILRVLAHRRKAGSRPGIAMKRIAYATSKTWVLSRARKAAFRKLYPAGPGPLLADGGHPRPLMPLLHAAGARLRHACRLALRFSSKFARQHQPGCRTQISSCFLRPWGQSKERNLREWHPLSQTEHREASLPSRKPEEIRRRVVEVNADIVNSALTPQPETPTHHPQRPDIGPTNQSQTVANIQYSLSIDSDYCPASQ
jgi:hypothetical protein